MSTVFNRNSHPEEEAAAEPVPCPRCGQTVTEPLGPVNSTLDWFRCVLCRHIWATHPSQPARTLAAGRRPPTPTPTHD